jgi:hypothetical protein
VYRVVIRHSFHIAVNNRVTSTSSITSFSTKTGSKTTSVPSSQSISSTSSGTVASTTKGASAKNTVNVGILAASAFVGLVATL